MAKKKYPVPPKLFKEEILKSKAQGKLTEKAGHYILLMVQNIQKIPSFHCDCEHVRNDVCSTAVQIVCEKWYMYDEKKSPSPFSYLTSMAMNGLREGMNNHQKYVKKVDYRYDVVFNESV